MPRTILITGAAKTDCLRIRDALRRRFRQSKIQLRHDSGLFKDGILVVSSVDADAVSAGSDELKEKIHRTEFLLDIARILSSAKGLDQALWKTAEKSKEILGDTAFVFLREGDEPELRCVASTRPEQVKRIIESLVNLKSEAKAKLQEVFRTGEAIRSSDVSLVDLPEDIERLIQEFDFMSLMAIPIKKEDEIYGVFITISSAPNHFEEWQYNLSKELAQAMARAVSQARLIAHLEQQANTDSMTGLYNRRFFDEVLHREAARAERHRIPLTLLMLDVDDFKRINDLHGHPAGDAALQGVASILQSSVRREDFLFRFGGDEFGIVLPDTGEQGALHVAENIRKRVEAEMSVSTGLNVRISIGVSEHELKETEGAGITDKEREAAVQSLIKHADEALYKAKDKGKNRVEIYRPPSTHDASA